MNKKNIYLKSENGALANRCNTLQDEIDEMRSQYYKELAVYKTVSK